MKDKKVKVQETERKDSVVYNGNVTITLKKGNTVISRKKTHNNGTSILFRALCMLLCGDEQGLSNVPYFIDAGIMQGGSFVSLLTSPTVITRRTPIFDGSTWKAQFISTIVYSQIRNPDTPIQILSLENSQGETLARITLDAEDYIQIESSIYTAMIEWEVYFNNPTT